MIMNRIYENTLNLLNLILSTYFGSVSAYVLKSIELCLRIMIITLLLFLRKDLVFDKLSITKFLTIHT